MSSALLSCLRRVHRLFSFFGLDPRMLLWTIRGFVFDLVRYSRTNQERSFRVNAIDLYPILHERYQDVGALRGYYFTQDLWPSRNIFARHPANHLGIGLRVDGLVAHLLTCIPVKVVDIRAADTVPRLTFLQDDATELARFPDASVDSISVPFVHRRRP